MLNALLLACMAQAPTAWQPRTQGASFELTLPASVEQMRHALTRPRGDQQLVWVPGVLHAPAQDMSFTEGPVRRLQVLPKKRGVIILLSGRAAAPLQGQLALLGAPHALLRVGPPLPASPSDVSDISRLSQNATATDLGTMGAAPHAWSPDNPLGMRPTTWVVWGAGCTFLLCVAYLVRQRAKPSDSGSIEIVAVRSLSARHKLTLVIAGGERLLLATTDKEVILLSHLGPAETADDVEIESETAPNTAPNTSAKVFKLPKRPAANAVAPDVMGLLRLKQPRGAA